MRNIFKSAIFQLFFIICITSISYSNILLNDFVIDDKVFIVDWPLIQDFGNITAFFQGAVPQGHEGVYRPIRSVIYTLEYNLFGINPIGYHMQSILIHLASTILVYFIVLEILRRNKQESQKSLSNRHSGTDWKESACLTSVEMSRIQSTLSIPKRFWMRFAYQNDENSSIIPFITSLLFGLHPIHTETISYIAASLETFGTLFFFISFYFYLRFSNSATKQFNNRYFIISLLFALLAFFTYEMTLTLPLLMVLYELCFSYSKSPTDNHLPNSKVKTQNAKLQLKTQNSTPLVSVLRFTLYTLNFQRITPYLALASLYLFIRFFILDITSRGPYLADSFYLTMLTMTKVFVKYISLLVLPVNQANNHIISKGIEAFVYRDYRTEAIKNQSIFDLQIIISLVIFIALIIFAVKYVKKYPIISFSIGWFFISLLPVSEIVPQGSMLNEKLLYIPSLGFILILSFLMKNLISNIKFPISNFKFLPLLLLALGYSYLTFQRNFDWKNEITLWAKDLAVYPKDNAYAHLALGNAYTAQKQYSRASEQYQKAVATNPKFGVGIASAARTYASMGNNDQAITWYKKAIELNPTIWEAYYNIGNIYLQQNNTKEALNAYKKVLEINPNFTPAKEMIEKLSGSVIASPTAPRNDDNQPSLNDLLSLSNASPSSQSTADFKVSFSYPKGFNKKDNNGIVTITNSNKSFTVLLKRDTKDPKASLDQYIKNRTDSHGTLLNQGLAKIPNVDIAYVKIWSDNNISKHQFFLFKENKIIEVLVYPSDSQLMKDFDTILGSIQF